MTRNRFYRKAANLKQLHREVLTWLGQVFLKKQGVLKAYDKNCKPEKVPVDNKKGMEWEKKSTCLIIKWGAQITLGSQALQIKCNWLLAARVYWTDTTTLKRAIGAVTKVKPLNQKEKYNVVIVHPPTVKLS